MMLSELEVLIVEFMKLSVPMDGGTKEWMKRWRKLAKVVDLNVVSDFPKLE